MGNPGEGGDGETGNNYTHTHHCLIFWKKGKEEGANKNGAGTGLKGAMYTGSDASLCPPPPPIVRLTPLLPVKIVPLPIALFTVTFSHLRDNVFKRGREAISGKSCRIARNCLTSTFKYIVVQMREGNREKGYSLSTLY